MEVAESCGAGSMFSLKTKYPSNFALIKRALPKRKVLSPRFPGTIPYR